MSPDAVPRTSQNHVRHVEQLGYAREIVHAEGQSLVQFSHRLDGAFCEAVRLLLNCRGNVIVTGMGKAGLVGRKIAATLASTGTGSHFLHPGEAVHGDLGAIHPSDLVLALSFSGETEEVVRLIPSLLASRTPLLAITAHRTSTLGKAAHQTIELGPVEEAGELGLAPSTSTTLMLAVGDALALVASRERGFRREDFARFHPGGSLGRKLAHVEQVMRPLDDCRVAAQESTVREVLIRLSRPGRRTGAIMLVDSRGALTGLFTDSDLARLLEERRDSALDIPIQNVMTLHPTHVPIGTRLIQAVGTMAAAKISELPVIGQDGTPVGLIDITDVVGLMGMTEGTDRTSNEALTPTEDDGSPGPDTLRFPQQHAG